MTNPQMGGSYIREKDGSLTQIDAPPTPLTVATDPMGAFADVRKRILGVPAEQSPTETSVEETDTAETGKKGKA